MLNFKINAQVCIHTLADLKVGHFVELSLWGQVEQISYVRIKEKVDSDKNSDKN